MRWVVVVVGPAVTVTLVANGNYLLAVLIGLLTVVRAVMFSALRREARR